MIYGHTYNKVNFTFTDHFQKLYKKYQILVFIQQMNCTCSCNRIHMSWLYTGNMHDFINCNKIKHSIKLSTPKVEINLLIKSISDQLKQRVMKYGLLIRNNVLAY